MRKAIAALGLLLLTGFSWAALDSAFDSSRQIARDGNPKLSSALYDLLVSSRANSLVDSSDTQFQTLAAANTRVVIKMHDEKSGLPAGWGIQIISQNGQQIEAWVPLSKLEALADLDEVDFVDIPANSLNPFTAKNPVREKANEIDWMGIEVLLAAVLLTVAGMGAYYRFCVRSPNRFSPTKKH